MPVPEKPPLADGLLPAPGKKTNSIQKLITWLFGADGLQRLSPRFGNVIPPLLTALIVALATLELPHFPEGLDPDSSWSAVLAFGHEKGLQFGSDLVFTYGPAGFLISPYYSPSSPGLRILAGVALCGATAAGVCLLAWRMARLWRCLLLAVYVFFSSNLNAQGEGNLGADFLLQTGLVCWGMLCLVETRRRLPVWALAFTLFLVAGALTKVSFLFAAGLSTVAVGLAFILRGKWVLGFGMAVGIGLGVLLAWVILGQHLSNFPAFLHHSWSVTVGYGRVMTVEGSYHLRRNVLLALFLSLPAVYLGAVASLHSGDEHVRARRTLRLLWLSGLLFMVWKHGFTMEERGHAGLLLGNLAVLTLILGGLAVGLPTAGAWARGLSLACLVVALGTAQAVFAESLALSLARPFVFLPRNIRELSNPAAFIAKMNEVQRDQCRSAELPHLRTVIGQRSVDVYGARQSYALFNGLHYQPRPVFQSYAAYSRPLAELNEEFYLSKRAPEFVLFWLQTFNRRLPALEDSLVFRHLLTNYELADAEGPFLLLRATTAEPARLTLVGEGSVRPGEAIELKKFGDADLWMQVELKASLAGQLRQTLYKPPKVRLVVWRNNPEPHTVRFNAPAQMLAAGFLASPFVLDNNSVRELYTAQNKERPQGYALELSPGTQYCWETVAAYRIYRVEGQASHPDRNR